MKIMLEVGGYETIFASFEVYEDAIQKKVLFNFLNLSPEQYSDFCNSSDSRIFLDQKNSVISFRCVKENIQFSILLENKQKYYFNYYSHGGIAFSAKDKLGNQYEDVFIFKQ